MTKEQLAEAMLWSRSRTSPANKRASPISLAEATISFFLGVHLLGLDLIDFAEHQAIRNLAEHNIA